MISIDTEIMRQLASACSAANDSIDEAVDILNRVTSHNDWGCKERDSINEYTNQNKAKIRALQEKSRGFLSVLTSVSHDFENAESSISDMFSSLESVLGDVISNATAWTHTTSDWHQGRPSVFDNIISDITAISPGGNILNSYDHFVYNEDGTILYGIKSGDPLANYSVRNLSSAIAVCNFDDLTLGS